VNSWLVMGPVENWETAPKQPIPLWGLRPRYRLAFDSIRPGDLAIFYVTAPVKGIVGFWTIRDTYVDGITLIWPQEVAQRSIEWPLRFRMGDVKYLPRPHWGPSRHSGLPTRIPIAHLNLNWQVGFQPLDKQTASEILATTRSQWGEEIIVPAAIIPEEPPVVREAPAPSQRVSTSDHRMLQESLVQIGRLQNYFAEVEFPFPLETDQRRLDVVWKRELAGSPTLAFEVELSGAIERAVVKLKIAFNRWNSQPRIIAPTEQHHRVQGLLAAKESRFREHFRIYESDTVAVLLAKKRDLRDFERQIGLY
jgi:hypothetical protein